MIQEPKEFRIGIAEFRSMVETPTLKQLGQTLARMFQERLSGLERKGVPLLERRGYVRGLLERERLLELKRVDELVSKRDQMALTFRKEKDMAAYVELTARIQEGMGKIRQWETLSAGEVALDPQDKPIRWAEPNQRGELLPPVLSTLREASQSGNVDYLITGTVEEEFENVFTLRVLLYSNIAREILFQGEIMGRKDELESLVDQLTVPLVSSLVGEQWAGLEIDVQPKDAGVFINGKLEGVGKVRKPYVSTGMYRLEIQRPGYFLHSQEVTLDPQERKRLSITMEPMPLPSFKISSLPQNSSIYVGAERLGNTPLTVEGWRGGEIARLEKEGYFSSVFALDSKEPEVAVSLYKGIYSWKDRLEQKREGFYRSLGWFILSIPLPVLVYGYYENESFKYIQYQKSAGYSFPESKKLSDRLNSLYYGYLGTLFLSGSLLFNAIFSLMDYLRAGEGSVRNPQGKKEG